MGSPSSAVEAARRRLRDVVRRGEKLGLTRSDLVSLPAARRLTNCGSRWCWRSTSLAITALTVILAATAILTKCFVYHQPTTAAYPSGVSAASLDPWWQPQQFQRLVSVDGLFVCLWLCCTCKWLPGYVTLLCVFRKCHKLSVVKPHETYFSEDV
jgi:hypothetical protein